MKKWKIWILMLNILLVAMIPAGLTETATPVPAANGATLPEQAATPAPAQGQESAWINTDPWGMMTLPPLATVEPGILSGFVIGIDPGHQAHGNSEREAVAPGSSETKAKVSSGTQGVSTRVPEHEVNLTVSLKLRDALTGLGATVYMTRETADVDISNQERALMMNAHACDLVLRLHCNGSTDSSVTGIGTYVRATGEGAEESARAAEYVLDAMCEATGARRDGLFRRDTYTGLNWSTVPCVMVEMGFMSNPEEDQLLNDPEYLEMLITGMVEGVISYAMEVQRQQENDAG